MNTTFARLLALTAIVVTTAGATDSERIARQVRHELVMLPYYSVFDNFTYRLDGPQLTLAGQVTRPTLASAAERVVQRVEGISEVVNNIEVLPVSSNDDRIRSALFRAIYYHPVLSRYAIQSVPPIHLIVKNGTVTLERRGARRFGTRHRGLAGERRGGCLLRGEQSHRREPGIACIPAPGGASRPDLETPGRSIA